MTILVKLSETEKRVIFALVILVILIFALIAVIGSLIVKTMKYQGKKMDTLVSDVVTTRVITTKRKFLPYARQKNRQLYFKQSIVPIIILFIAALILIIYDAANKDFTYNPFNTTNGFGTLIYTFDFKDPDIYQKFFGVTVIADWPKVANTPHFTWDAWAGYLFVPLAIVGGIWYLVVTQAFIARMIRMRKLAGTIFEKPLDNFNQNSPLPQPQQPTESN